MKPHFRLVFGYSFNETCLKQWWVVDKIGRCFKTIEHALKANPTIETVYPGGVGYKDQLTEKDIYGQEHTMETSEIHV